MAGDLILSDQTYVISSQVILEFSNVCMKKGLLSLNDIMILTDKFIDNFDFMLIYKDISNYSPKEISYSSKKK
jgi:predicted nucleic acid-binding protein